MKILLDMNLPPIWGDFLENEGFQAIQRSGNPDLSGNPVEAEQRSPD